MRVAVCGGTFDPFHCGHVEPLLTVRDDFGWDEILFVPAATQPFKSGRTSASSYHRFAMAVLATENEAGVRVSPLELERGAISWTVDTLEALVRERPHAHFDWVIGDDNLARLHEWRAVDRILELASFVVLMRSEATTDALAPELRRRLAERRSAAAGELLLARNERVPVSSTEVRRRLTAGESIEGLVHPRVSRYIDQNALYRKDPA